MNQDKSPITIKRLIILIAITVAVLGGYLVFKAAAFKVIQVNPNPGSFPTESFFVDVYFNRDVKDHVIRTEPNVIKSTKAEGKKIRITLSDLSEKNYKLILENVTSTNGQSIKNKRITLKARSIPFDKLPKDLQKELLDFQEKNKNVEVTDPIMQHLPHRTINYSITPKILNLGSNKRRVIITVKVLLSASETKPERREGVILQYRKEADIYLNSLSEKGIDLKNYDIVYTPSLPSDSPASEAGQENTQPFTPAR